MNSFIVILKNKNLSSFMLVSPKEPNLYFTVGKGGKKNKHLFYYRFQDTQIVCKGTKCHRTSGIRKLLFTALNEALALGNSHKQWLLGL